MNVLFVTSVAVVAADPPQSRKLFIDALGLPLEGEGDGYYSSGSIPGSKHFGVWPLSQAAEACFGTPEWPAGRVIPQASIEFEVEDADAVAAAGGELERAGYELLHPARTEPWGQTVARLLTEDGLIVGISYAPPLARRADGLSVTDAPPQTGPAHPSVARGDSRPWRCCWPLNPLPADGEPGTIQRGAGRPGWPSAHRRRGRHDGERGAQGR